MFEDFSFSSPSSARPPRLALDGDDRLMIDCDSALVSPMSSRCPSPQSLYSSASFSAPRFPRSLPRSRSLHFRPQPPPTSVPFSAYDDHNKRLSIGALTRKLHEHTIQNPSSLDRVDRSRPASPTRTATTTSTPRSSCSSSRRFPGYVLTPPDTDHDDEGYAESPFSPLTSLSPSLSPQPQSPFLNPTSAPFDFLTSSSEPTDPTTTVTTSTLQNDPWPSSVRSRRQQLSRLQCDSSDLEAIRRALLSDDDNNPNILRITPLLTEDCHPSSLPPQQAPRRRTISLQRPRVRSHMSMSPDTPTTTTASDPPLRRKSINTGAGSLPVHRIEKSYQHTADHRKKSEQGLRRKSLVSAALASMIERGE